MKFDLTDMLISLASNAGAVRRLAASALVLLASAACSSPAPLSAARSADRVDEPGDLIAQRCAALSTPPGALDRAKARVFVEVAEVTTPDLPRPIGDWLDRHPVELRTVSSLLTTDGLPVSIDWGACVDAECTAKQSRLTVTTRLPALASEPIEFAIQMEFGAHRPPTRVTAHTADQTPFVLDTSLNETAAGQSGGPSLVVMPFLMSGEEGLQVLLQCKREQRDS